MCGIFAYSGSSNQAAQTTLKGLKKLEYRGYDSWGIAVKSEKGLRLEKHVGKIGRSKVSLPASGVAIGHTRWATHGKVTVKNAHPHFDCKKKLAIIHNGIFENYQEVKSDLLKKGHRFKSKTDTEVVVHLIEELAKKYPVKRAVFKALCKLKGSNAIVVLDDKGRIYACRNGSPLVVGLSKSAKFLASDVTPFLKFTQKAYFLKDGEAVVIKNNQVNLFKLNLQIPKPLKPHNPISQNSYTPIPLKPQTIDWQAEAVQKQGFVHFMLKEIYQQPEKIIKTTSLNQKEIRGLAKKIKKTKKIHLCGCGSAYFCGLAAKYFFSQSGVEAQVYGAYEFLPFASNVRKNEVFMAISQSGETADTLIASKNAQKKGAFLVAVLNARGSTLERLAKVVLLVGAGPEIAVVSTKAFLSQLSTLYLLSQAVKGEYKKARKQLKEAGEKIAGWLNQDLKNEVVSLAKNLTSAKSIYLIGKHLNYPGALEFALKLKETSYVHAEAFASGELKHGVISLVEKQTPVIVLANNNRVKSEVLLSAMEVKSRGGRIIGVAPFKAEEFDQLIKTPDLGELTVLANIIVGQLLAYYLGVSRGVDPDKPRNLAKSVTVK